VLSTTTKKKKYFCSNNFQFCTSQGGILAEIYNADQMEVIKTFLDGIGPGSAYIWIGLTDIAQEGRYVWGSNLSLVSGKNNMQS
jgi:hypothetical protein